jgi:hypothetical protein
MRGVIAMTKSGALQLASGAVLGLLAILSPCRAQEPVNPEELRKLCETMLCRGPGSVRLTLDNGEPFETRFGFPRSIVQNEWVSIHPGETVFVEAEVRGERLVNLKAVESNDNPDRTLTFEFSQELSPANMMLIVTNPFNSPVKYHAAMMLPSDDKLRKTSSCPVVANGGKAFEAWPHAVFQLVLFDFRLLDSNATTMSCEY